jgi:hypothetical protein
MAVPNSDNVRCTAGFMLDLGFDDERPIQDMPRVRC